MARLSQLLWHQPLQEEPMPCCPTVTDSDPCVLDEVRPLLAERQPPLSLQVVPPEHEERPNVERFIHEVYRRAYGADIQPHYPNLLSFRTGNGQHAAVGYRDGSDLPLFSEQYLPQPADEMIAAHLGKRIARGTLVEVGNLAIADSGEARRVIAAVTFHLYRLGYRWVLFTAVRPLFNAFRRLGLNPIQLAQADAARLPDRGESWGSYYAARPVVCVGNIESGYRKLGRHALSSQPSLHALFREVSQQAELAGASSDSLYGGLK
jgi:hypothetical protein